MNKDKILIVEDEKSLNEVLKVLLEDEGYDVYSAFNGKEGIDCLNKDIFDLVITDIKMPSHDGFEVLKKVKELSPDTIVLMITAYGTIESAIEAMKSGAYDYINKPFKIDEIRLVVKNAIEKRRLNRELKNLRTHIDKAFKLDNIVGKSPKMRELFYSIPKIAEINSSVLISGESGSGKDLIAHSIHNLSKRANNEFVAINCAALPEGLLESELFGHMKGSFTGATFNKEGLFEIANGGTIFLDEIGDMPIALQAKLFRVIEDSTFRRIGGTKDIKVNVRIVSATNKNLKEETAKGSFRKELFYRLNVIPIQIPPLRERRADIPLLVENFLGKKGFSGRKFSKKAIDIMMEYPWHGNVRELENILERVLTFSESPVIDEKDLPQEIKHLKYDIANVESINESTNLDEMLEDIEKQYLQKALEITKGVKTSAAKLLNISFRQFRHRLKKFGIK